MKKAWVSIQTTTPYVGNPLTKKGDSTGKFFQTQKVIKEIIRIIWVVEIGTNSWSPPIKKLHSLTWLFLHQKIKTFFDGGIFSAEDKSENASLSKINITICHDFFDTLPYLVICLINPTTQNNRKPAMALLCFPRKYQASISGKTTITSNKRFKKKKKRYVNIPGGWLWVVTLSSNNVTRAKRKLLFRLTMELNHAYWLNGLL